MQAIGRLMIGVGVLLVVCGAVVLVAGRIPWLGRLPGDILVRRDHVTVYFPIVTSIVLSILLTVLLNLFWRR
jgi:hypothetical protein